MLKSNNKVVGKAQHEEKSGLRAGVGPNAVNLSSLTLMRQSLGSFRRSLSLTPIREPESSLFQVLLTPRSRRVTVLAKRSFLKLTALGPTPQRIAPSCGLANELIEARDAKIVGRAIKRYGGYGLLIVGELGYVPFSKEGAALLFQVLAERHERKSVITTSNMGFGDWTQIFGDPNLTAALLDLISHSSHSGAPTRYRK